MFTKIMVEKEGELIHIQDLNESDYEYGKLPARFQTTHSAHRYMVSEPPTGYVVGSKGQIRETDGLQRRFNACRH